MWDYLFDYLDTLDKYESQCKFECELDKYESQCIFQHELDKFQSNNITQNFNVVYSVEMPKGGFFEGCTLELLSIDL